MITEKRKQLEDFIREQVLGPGATGYRILDLADQDVLRQPFRPLLEHEGELINIIPAGVYSTGILFPEDRSTRDGMPTGTSSSDLEGDNANAPEEDEGEPPVEEEPVSIDTQSLNQMYPTTMGLTVCLHKQVITDNDLQILISGRYYTKLDLRRYDPGIAVLLEQDKIIFQAFLAALPEGDLIRTSVTVNDAENGSSFITLRAARDIQALKARYYEIKRAQNDKLKEQDEHYRSIEVMKEALFNKLRRNILPASEEGVRIIERLKEIEQAENSLAHLLDLINLYDTSGYGAWKCTSFQVPVGMGLPVPDQVIGRKIYSYKEEKDLADVWRYDYAEDKKAALAVNLQYSEDKERPDLKDRVFLKVQLLNMSTPFSDADTRQGRNYFSLASEEVNKRCFFGVQIKVQSRHLLPSRPMLLEEKAAYDEDEQTYYNYRQFKDFGVGHGCSVRWQQEGVQKTVLTEYIPVQDTPDVDPIPRDKQAPFEKKGHGYEPAPIFGDTTFLQFKWLSTLSDASNEAVIAGLKQFVDAYKIWIDHQQDPGHPGIAEQIRNACRRDLLRMQNNIELLQGEVLQCFRLMNTAMFMQLWHGVKAKKGQVSPMITADFQGFFEVFYRQADDRLFEGEQATWRPFQLAFILLNLDGVFQPKDDPEWKVRNDQVDLVWFPTGGGKTEAYLGLIALTIINRRKQFKAEGGGTAVMMRYTLRLLTTQQFQRATLLIMALELIRRWGDYGLGEEPIYIGLYVGGSSLPNKLEDLKKEYAALKTDQQAGRVSRSKVPLRNCPWCGHELKIVQSFSDLTGTFEHNRVLLGCSRDDKSCAFSLHLPLRSKRKDQGPIPISLCDEEIYQHPPALLFGTVDKFAQIAHKISRKNPQGDSRRLFGVGEWEDGKPKDGYLPPDLIIQDELHLMMGPLGSAVALFESAIDRLCTRSDNIRPKVISSTATTRNTHLQIMALFDRRVNIFPKPGIDCDDSFFAFYKRAAKDERKTGERYIAKRRYMGILPTGRTQMWMQLRLSAILLTHRAVFEGKALDNAYPIQHAYPPDLAKAIDYYYTVLSYFNSLREVGKTESQIYTYLLKEIRRVFNKVVRPDKLMQCFYTYDTFRTGELTGRLSGEEVVDEMASISTAWSPEKRMAHGTPEVVRPGIAPPDFVVSTNMISVGIDISRFNSMIMNCMPRNIAEYIQATSRVARDKEGLVITVHHPFRSRDISHYERFIEFHEKMYSYVEPISITPFTRKALERYLPLYIATMIRHRAYVEREAADTQLTAAEREGLLHLLTVYFSERKTRLQGMDVEATVKQLLTDNDLVQINELVEEAIEAWQEEFQKAASANEALMFNYKAKTTKGRPQRQLYVDINEYQDNIHSELWRIPQSLRVVEPEAVIRVNPK